MKTKKIGKVVKKLKKGKVGYLGKPRRKHSNLTNLDDPNQLTDLAESLSKDFINDYVKLPETFKLSHLCEILNHSNEDIVLKIVKLENGQELLMAPVPNTLYNNYARWIGSSKGEDKKIQELLGLTD